MADMKLAVDRADGMDIWRRPDGSTYLLPRTLDVQETVTETETEKRPWLKRKKTKPYSGPTIEDWQKSFWEDYMGPALTSETAKKFYKGVGKVWNPVSQQTAKAMSGSIIPGGDWMEKKWGLPTGQSILDYLTFDTGAPHDIETAKEAGGMKLIPDLEKVGMKGRVPVFEQKMEEGKPVMKEVPKKNPLALYKTGDALFKVTMNNMFMDSKTGGEKLLAGVPFEELSDHEKSGVQWTLADVIMSVVPFKLPRFGGKDIAKSVYGKEGTEKIIKILDEQGVDLTQKKPTAYSKMTQEQKDLRNARRRSLRMHERLSTVGFDESRLRRQHQSPRMKELEAEGKLTDINKEARKTGDWDTSYQEKYPVSQGGDAQVLAKKPDYRVKEPGSGTGKPGTGTGRGETKVEIENMAKRKAIVDHLQPIYDAAKKTEKGAVLPAHWKFKEIENIVAKNKDLFPDGLDTRTLAQILWGSKSGKHRVSFPIDAPVKKTAQLQKDIAKETGERAGGQVQTISRSFPKELDTIKKVKEFFNSQGIDLKKINKLVPRETATFENLTKGQKALYKFYNEDPLLQKYFKTNLLMYDEAGRFTKKSGELANPIIVQRSHIDRTINPKDPSFNFQGMDTSQVKLLGATVNTKLQPDLEWALATHIKNKNVKNSKRIIKDMEDVFIGTKLNDTKQGFPKLNNDDYKWLIENKIVDKPQYNNYDEIVFGTTKQPDTAELLQGEMIARKMNLAKKKYRKEKAAEGVKRNPGGDFYKMLSGGGIVNASDVVYRSYGSPPGGEFTNPLNITGEETFDIDDYQKGIGGEYEDIIDFDIFMGDDQAKLQQLQGEKDLVQLAMAPGAKDFFFKLFGKPAEYQLEGITKKELANLTKKQKGILASIGQKATDIDPGKVFYSNLELSLGKKGAPESFASEKEFFDYVNGNGISFDEISDARVGPYVKAQAKAGNPILTQDILEISSQSPLNNLRSKSYGFRSEKMDVASKDIMKAHADEVVTKKGEPYHRRAKYGSDSGIQPGYVDGTYRERVLFVDKDKFRGDPGTKPQSGHGFDEDYVIAWSRLTDRDGIIRQGEIVDADTGKIINQLMIQDRTKLDQLENKVKRLQGIIGGTPQDLVEKSGGRMPLAQAEKNMAQAQKEYDKSVAALQDERVKLEKKAEVPGEQEIRMTMAQEIQSDLQQQATRFGRQLALKLEVMAEQGLPVEQMAEGVQKELMQHFEKTGGVARPVGATKRELMEQYEELMNINKMLGDISKKRPYEIQPQDLAFYESVKPRQMEIIDSMADDISKDLMKQLYPDIPLKDRSNWIDAIIKRDLYEAAHRLFVEKDANAPTYFGVNSGDEVARAWSQEGSTATSAADRLKDKNTRTKRYKDELREDINTDVELEGTKYKGVGTHEAYGGPLSVTEEGKHYTGEAERSLRKLANDNNSKLVIINAKTASGRGNKVYNIIDQETGDILGNGATFNQAERIANDLVDAEGRQRRTTIKKGTDRKYETTPIFGIKLTPEMLQLSKAYQ